MDCDNIPTTWGLRNGVKQVEEISGVANEIYSVSFELHTGVNDMVYNQLYLHIYVSDFVYNQQ